MIGLNLEVLMEIYEAQTGEELSIKELHHHTGVSEKTLREIAKNKVAYIDLETLGVLCKFFDCEPGVLFRREEELSNRDSSNILPKRVRLCILGHDYEIREEKIADAPKDAGRVTFARQTIQIASGTANDTRLSTVLHEIIEVLNFRFELKLKHGVIMSLEAGLYQVLKDAGIDLSPLLESQNDA